MKIKSQNGNNKIESIDDMKKIKYLKNLRKKKNSICNCMIN